MKPIFYSVVIGVSSAATGSWYTGAVSNPDRTTGKSIGLEKET